MIKKLAEPLCKDKNYIQKYDVKMKVRPTSTEWTGKENIEEYRTEYVVALKIYLQDGKMQQGNMQRRFLINKGNYAK